MDFDHKLGFWGRFTKSTFATVVVIVPVLISEYALNAGSWNKLHVISIFSLFIFITSWFVFKPDLRFLNIRIPTLNSTLGKKFEAIRAGLKPGERLPFRVNVMQPQGFGPWKKMIMTYSYGMLPTDPDYDLTLAGGRGLCWEVLKRKKVGWYDSQCHDPKEFGLNEEEIAATQHVKGLISLPIRSVHNGSRQKIAAILSIDALSDEALEFLRTEITKLNRHQNTPLSDLVEFFGLYF